MRFTICHETIYRYSEPANALIQLLRLTPRSHDGQFVNSWRIDVTADSQLFHSEDAFCNITHTFTLDGPVSELSVIATGDLDTEDTAGLVRGTAERLPLPVFLRTTPLTAPSEAIKALAHEARSGSDGSALDVAHRLNMLVHDTIVYDPQGTDVTTPAHVVCANGRGVCQDLAHVLLSTARYLNLPARYVSGYHHSPDLAVEFRASHAWAEVHIDGLGWIALDPSTGLSTTDVYARLAVGLDYLSAAPLRGTRYGGQGEELSVTVDVAEAKGRFVPRLPQRTQGPAQTQIQVQTADGNEPWQQQ